MADITTQPVVFITDEHAVVLSTIRPAIVQPVLSQAESDMLRAITQRGVVRNLISLAREIGYDYNYAYSILRRLEQRGLVSASHYGCGIPLIIRPLARLIEAT